MKDIKTLLGKRIKELRKGLNISQQELAELVEIDQRSMSSIECGVNFPSKTILKIAEALKVTLPELFDFEHLKIDSDYMKKYIIDYLKNVSDENLKIIYRIIRSMK